MNQKTTIPWILKVFVTIGLVLLLLRIAVVPILTTLLLGLLGALLLVAVAAVAIPGAILYGMGRVLGWFRGKKRLTQPQERVIEGEADAVEGEWREVSAEEEQAEQAGELGIYQQLHRLIARHREALAAGHLIRLESILQVVGELERALRGFGIGSEYAFTLNQAVESYIPEMLSSYLALPSDFATRYRLANGHTPSELLAMQLDLLDEELKRLRDAVYARKSEELVVHGEFLREKFARRKSFLDLP